MSRDAVVLLSMILLGAVSVVWHFALFARLVRSERLGVVRRVLSVLPPLTPVIGVMAGERVRSAIWTALLIAYLVLWYLYAQA